MTREERIARIRRIEKIRGLEKQAAPAPESGTLESVAKTLDPISTSLKGGLLRALGKISNQEYADYVNPAKHSDVDFAAKMGVSTEPTEFFKYTPAGMMARTMTAIPDLAIKQLTGKDPNLSQYVIPKSPAEYANLVTDTVAGIPSGMVWSKILGGAGKLAKAVAPVFDASQPGPLGGVARIVESATEAPRRYLRGLARFSPEAEQAYLNRPEQVRNLVNEFKTDEGMARVSSQAQDVIQKVRDLLKQKGIDQWEKDIIAKVTGEKIDLPPEVINAINESGSPELQALLRKNSPLNPNYSPIENKFIPERPYGVQEGMEVSPTTRMTEAPISTSGSPEAQLELFNEPYIQSLTERPRTSLQPQGKIALPDETLLDEFKLQQVPRKSQEANLAEYYRQKEAFDVKGRHKLAPDEALLEEVKIVPKSEKEIDASLLKFLKQKETFNNLNNIREQSKLARLGEGLQQELVATPDYKKAPTALEQLKYTTEPITSTSKVVPPNYQVQEALPLPSQARKTYQVMGEDAQKIKKILQKLSKFPNMTSEESVAWLSKEAKKANFGDAASATQALLEEVHPSIKYTNRELQQGILLQDELESALKNPLRFLSSQTKDSRARLGRVANRLGDRSLQEQAANLQAATAMHPIDIDDALSRPIERWAGRTGLKSLDLLGKTTAEPVREIGGLFRDQPVAWSLMNERNKR